jgi:lipoprotein NlpD
MTLIRNGFLLILISLIAACSTAPAPVIDRTPTTASSKQSATKPTSKSITKTTSAKNTGDWRPDRYTVKKGDTLFSIGLEYGYDYKEIARANNIEPPYVIKVGQTLNMDSLKEPSDSKAITPKTSTVDDTSSSAVTTYALDSGDSVQPTTSGTATPATPNINAPKASREIYSPEAMNKPIAPEKANATVTTKAANDTKAATEVKPEAQSNVQQTLEVAGISWSWPTKGKVIANFNEAGNKGIDIAGAKGQAIHAAAAGKVIYSGSDLRGYGKLVIIKHNNTYLSVYANNSHILVKEGQQVSAGQKIAEMGDTDSNVVKLHFEIRQQGKSVDPMKFLASN